MPSDDAILALRDLAKHHDYTAESKRQEARMLEREASIHSSLWASLDNMADAMERDLQGGSGELEHLLSILDDWCSSDTEGSRVDEINNEDLILKAWTALRRN